MQCYFPASGLRKREMGALRNVSQEGELWSASSYTAESCGGISAYSTVEGVSPFFLTYRVNGFPVRCVQELIKLCGL